MPLQQQQQHSPTSMAWDPKNPSALLLPCKPSASTTARNKNTEDGSDKITAMQINTILSHTGIGCNEHELAALLELLNAHEYHYSQKPAIRSEWKSTKQLSKTYRSALRECLYRWEDHLIELEENGSNNNNINDNLSIPFASSEGTETNDDTDPDLSVENLELLKIAYAVTHLSEIFLLTPLTETLTLDYYDNIFVIPGALTADTVRYLRHHHTVTPLQQVDPDVLQEITDSMHPDQVDGGEPYWKLLNLMVRRGYLEQAWALLSRHSLFRRALDATQNTDYNEGMMDDDYEAMSLDQIKNDFLDLRGLLLSAPLPGGRDDIDDVGLDDDQDDDDGNSNNNEEKDTAVYLEGLRGDDYQLWETSRPTVKGNDFPQTYNPSAALHKRNVWQQYLLDLESVKRLRRRIPQLEPILTILAGNLKKIPFESWAEALLAELLYKNPGIVPGSIETRAQKCMELYPQIHGEMDSVLLSIMQGNAGGVIEVLYAFGGGSGSALPASVTSLLCNLYIDAKLQLPESLQTELLEAAAFAITSSLAKKNSDVGIQLAVRLLFPFARPKGDVHIVALLAETLERHTPSSDAEARNLLSLCQPLIEKKSVRVLDGCISIVLCRYRSYLADRRPGGALHWLLVGIELESFLCLNANGDIENWQSIESTSVCYRHLVTWCTRVAGTFLREMMEEKEGFGLIYSTAKAMVEAVEEGPLETYATKLPEVRTLELILGIYDGMTNNDDWTSAARNIIMCLAEESNKYDGGVVSAIAPPSMHWDLLQLGHRILQADEQREAEARLGEFCPSFDVKGVQVLMERLTTITLSRDVECLKPLPAELVHKMKIALGTGLKRAFVAENAKRKPDRSFEVNDTFISQIRSVELHKHSLATQEQVVQRMLDI